MKETQVLSTQSVLDHSYVFSRELDPKLLVKIHYEMLKARILRLIRMYKQSDGYFWIGGPI